MNKQAENRQWTQQLLEGVWSQVFCRSGWHPNCCLPETRAVNKCWWLKTKGSQKHFQAKHRVCMAERHLLHYLIQHAFLCRWYLKLPRNRSARNFNLSKVWNTKISTEQQERYIHPFRNLYYRRNIVRTRWRLRLYLGRWESETAAAGLEQGVVCLWTLPECQMLQYLHLGSSLWDCLRALCHIVSSEVPLLTRRKNVHERDILSMELWKRCEHSHTSPVSSITV